MIVLTDKSCYEQAVHFAFKQHIQRIPKDIQLNYFLHPDGEKSFNEVTGQKHFYNSLLNLIWQIFSNPDSKIFSPNAILTILCLPAIILKRKKVVTWVQGIMAEESYLKHNSKIKYYILSFLEYIAIKMSYSTIVVTDEMKVYLENKYNIKLKRSITVPCTSRFKLFDSEQEKKRNSFLYLGGVSAWQCLDKVIIAFNSIKKLNQDANLTIITTGVEQAEKLVKAYDKTDSVAILKITDPKLLEEEIKKFEFGFLIREDIPVNHVASPIKLAEYLSCGLSIITTKALKGYASKLEKSKVSIIIDIDQLENLPVQFQHNSLTSVELYKEIFINPTTNLDYRSLW